MESSKSSGLSGGARRKTLSRKKSKTHKTSNSKRVKSRASIKTISRKKSKKTSKIIKTKSHKGSKRRTKHTKSTQKGGACTDAEIMAAPTFGQLLLVVRKHQTDIHSCIKCNDINIISLLTGLKDIYESQVASPEAMQIPDVKTPQGRNEFNLKYNKNGSKLICNKCGIRAKIYQLINKYLIPEEKMDFQM